MVEETVGKFSQSIANKSHREENGHEMDQFLSKTDAVKADHLMPLGCRGGLDQGQRNQVEGLLAQASETGSARDLGGSADGGVQGDTHDYVGTRVDEYVESESEIDDKSSSSGTPAPEQQPLGDWESWPVENRGKVDRLAILKALAGAVCSALLFIVGFWRTRIKRTGAHPQCPKDVKRYKEAVSVSVSRLWLYIMLRCARWAAPSQNMPPPPCFGSRPVTNASLSRLRFSRLFGQEKNLEGAHGGDSYKPAVEALCTKIDEAGMGTAASRCLRANNYCVVQMLPVWLCCLIERFRADPRFPEIDPHHKAPEKMFRTSHGRDDIDYDEDRRLINCAYCGVLWILISSWTTLVMASYSFLMVVGTSVTRLARVVTYIESGAEGRRQCLHDDFSNVVAGWFGHEFGFSVLISCFGGSKIDVIEGTFGRPASRAFERENFVQIHLKQGQALIVGPGCRHRGCAYSERNVRLFLAFLVGRSNGASFSQTYNLATFERKKSPPTAAVVTKKGGAVKRKKKGASKGKGRKKGPGKSKASLVRGLEIICALCPTLGVLVISQCTVFR